MVAEAIPRWTDAPSGWVGREWEDETFGEIGGLKDVDFVSEPTFVLGPDVVALRPFGRSRIHLAATPILTPLRDSIETTAWRRLELSLRIATTPTHWESSLLIAPNSFGATYDILARQVWQGLVPWARFLTQRPDVRSQTPIVRPFQVARSTAVAVGIGPALALDQVRNWLGLTIEDVAAVTKISLRTLKYWQIEAVAPRARTIRPLWKVHGFAMALHRSLGDAGARRWLATGEPSHLNRLLAGDLAFVEAEARSVIFGDVGSRRRFSGFDLGDADIAQQAAVAEAHRHQLRRAERRPKRSQ